VHDFHLAAGGIFDGHQNRQAVLQSPADYITPDEVEKIKGLLPSDIRSPWP
jgi:uncharacterized protein (DUF2267 family)